jgi:hypothetical protein
MLKYLVGRYDPSHPGNTTFGEPFLVVHAKDREDAAHKYDRHFGDGQGHFGRVMGLVTLVGPMNLDPQCSHEVAKKAMTAATEVED